jgi:hypothetical protein
LVAKTPTDSKKKRGTQAIVIKEKPPVSKQEGRQAYHAMQKDLVSRLDHVRVEARQVCEAYLSNLDADITTLTDFLDGSSEVRTPADRKASTMRTWVATLDGIDVKPGKGRRKDLRRIDDAVKVMMKSAFE